MKKLIVSSVVLVAFLHLLSCNKNQQETPAAVTGKIIGKWTLSGLHVGGMGRILNECESKSSLSFAEDGLCQCTASVKGLKGNCNSVTVFIEYGLNDDVLSFSYTDEKTNYTLTIKARVLKLDDTRLEFKIFDVEVPEGYGGMGSNNDVNLPPPAKDNKFVFVRAN